MKTSNLPSIVFFGLFTFCSTAQIQNNTSAIFNWPSNYVHCNPTNPTVLVDIINPTTGKIWMDRNLGANRAALNNVDSEAYGSLFQWGRGADGHQCVNRYIGDGVSTSSTTSSLSSIDTPVHNNFIIINSGNINWRDPQNNDLWQGVNGINNPCPTGYRIPTEAELNDERLSWSNNNAEGAFASPLKLTLGGRRSFIDGSLVDVDTHGNYWSSTVNNFNSQRLRFFNSNADLYPNVRANGYSIRCIKNLVLSLDEIDTTKTTIFIKNHILQVFSNQSINQIEVYDINGRLILNYKLTDLKSTLIHPFNQSEGIYIVKVYLNNNRVITNKLVAN